MEFIRLDGGYSWIIVLCCFFLQFYAVGIPYSFGVIMIRLKEEYQSTDSIISWIGSIQGFMLYFTGIIAAPLTKHYSYRTIAISGTIISSIGLLVSAFSQNIYLRYITYGLVPGVGFGFMYLTSMVGTQHWFVKRRALASGLAAAGMGGGTLVFGAFQQYLLNTVGLQWTLCIEAATLIPMAILSLLLIPWPDNEAETVKLNSPTENGSNIAHGNPTSDIGNIFDFALFKKPTYILYCMGLLLFVCVYYIPNIYLPEYVVSLGISDQEAANLISVVGFANLASRLVFGLISDFGPKSRICLCSFSVLFLGVISIALPFFKTYAIFLVYATLFGTFVGSFVSLFSVILVDLYGVHRIEKALGQALAFFSPVFLFGPPLIGFLIDRFENITIAFYAPGIASILGGFSFLGILGLHDFSLQKYERIQ